jgi:lipoprotein-releasing system permease protein
MWLESLIALKFLRQNLVQTALILVGIAVGVSVIVFITTLINGLQANIIERTLGTQSHIRVEPAEEQNLIAPVEPGVLALIREDPRGQRLRSINNWIAVQSTLDNLEGVTAVSPVVSGPAFARRGNVLKSVSLVGIDPVRYEKIIPISDDIVDGTFRVGAGDAVIGRLLAKDLGLRTGSKMRIEAGDGRTALVTIVGIFELGVRELDLRYVYLNLKQTQSLLNLPGGVTLIDVTVENLFAADLDARRIGELTGMKAQSWIETNAQLMNALSSQRLSTTMITVFVALSVAFGIASVLAISVTQRTREIGILRAMGIRQAQMLRVFLVQGALLGIAGSAVGAVAGTGLVGAFNTFGPKLFYIPLSPGLIPITMIFAAFTGVLAASVPAWRAARLNPVEAIRYV